MLALGAVFLLNSCGYHLGGLKPKAFNDIESISVSTLTNDSLEPMAGTLVTNSIAESIQQEGTYKLKSKQDADARLTGRVVSIDYKQLRSSNHDSYLSMETNLILTVQYTITRARDNKVILNGTTTNSASLFNLNNLQTAKTNALSYAARLVGENVASSISNG